MTIPPPLQEAQQLMRDRRFHQAEVLIRRLLQEQPQLAEGWYALGQIALEAQQTHAAAELLRHALSLDPTHAEAQRTLAAILERPPLTPAQQEHAAGLQRVAERDYEQAIGHFRNALRLQPDYALAYNSLGNSYKHIGHLRAAVATFQAGLLHRPGESALCSNLGETQRMLGAFTEATTAYRVAMRSLPPFSFAHANYLVSLNYNPALTAQTLFAEHRHWGESAALPVQRHYPPPGAPQRKLRLGYISPDFIEHPVARFFEPILINHDRAHFDVYLYGEIPHPDEVTRRLQQSATAWRNTLGRSAGEVAAQVRADQIDLLIDLSGHYAHSRLDVLAQQPAPIQITYLGYPNTTGLSGVDYWLTDRVVNPPELPALASEQIVYLDGGFSCFQPPHPCPEVQPVPALTRGAITFGSHHTLHKLNDEVLRVWATLLQAVPTSRLLFLRSAFFPPILELLQERFAALDIDPQRIEIRRYSSQNNAYLQGYHEIDLLLDTWPFGGHTMTCEALWMGVPVVTLWGDRPCGRLSASVLTAIGMAEWIARTPEEYVTLATEFANNLPLLQHWRQTLRPRLNESLCAGVPFTRNLERVYRLLWTKEPGWEQLLHPQRPERPPPLPPEHYLRTAEQLHNAGKLAESEALTRRLLGSAAHFAPAWHHLARLAQVAGRIPQALEALAQALQLSPNEPHWRSELATLQKQLGAQVR